MKKTDSRSEKEKITCYVCGREISEDESDEYDGLCWECWADQLTYESASMYGELL